VLRLKVHEGALEDDVIRAHGPERTKRTGEAFVAPDELSLCSAVRFGFFTGFGFGFGCVVVVVATVVVVLPGAVVVLPGDVVVVVDVWTSLSSWLSLSSSSFLRARRSREDSEAWRGVDLRA